MPKPQGSADWFLPKRHGYGAGLPIAWQGWALLLGYLILFTGLALSMPHRHGFAAASVIVAMIATTLIFAFIVARHTRGGWRWRSGESD
jgi:hypothetical protein